MDQWGEDDDGTLTEDEFDTGVYRGYDEDESGMLEAEEQAAFEDDRGEEGFWDW